MANRRADVGVFAREPDGPGMDGDPNPQRLGNTPERAAGCPYMIAGVMAGIALPMQDLAFQNGQGTKG